MNMNNNSKNVDVLMARYDSTEMVDETISSIMQINKGESIAFTNKKIHIEAYINCEGEINFEHCIVYYNETNSAYEIMLKKGARLRINDSLFICKGFDTNYFIKYESGNLFTSCESNNEVEISKSTFVDCSCFFEGSDIHNFSMKECELFNCCRGFISISSGSFGSDSLYDISDNIMHQDDMAIFNEYRVIREKYPSVPSDFISISGASLDESSEGKVIFNNNTIIEKEAFKHKCDEEGSVRCFTYFCSDMAKVSNCSFINTSFPIKAGEITECMFKNAEHTIEGFLLGKTRIDNCVFTECTDVIRRCCSLEIFNCLFNSCYNSIIKEVHNGADLELCHFINIKNELEAGFMKTSDCIHFSGSDKYCTNTIRRCIFDGVELNDNYLIGTSVYKKPKHYVTLIEDCDFRNCITEKASGEIIQVHDIYLGLFDKRKECKSTEVRNCRGLDRINKVEGISELTA